MGYLSALHSASSIPNDANKHLKESMNLKNTAIGLKTAIDPQNETVRCSALANSAGRLRTWVGAIQLPESTTASHGIRNEAYNSK
jgi:hypothetical protein